VLAVTNKMRSPLWSEIPVMSEAGCSDFTFDGLIGVFAPGGMPDGRRQGTAADIRAIAADQAVAQRLRATGQIVRQSTPAEFAAAIDEQRSRLTAIIQAVGKPVNSQP
jgi:tripartite-type tricarboxylate transporter receptor subunit TctC